MIHALLATRLTWTSSTGRLRDYRGGEDCVGADDRSHHDAAAPTGRKGRQAGGSSTIATAAPTLATTWMKHDGDNETMERQSFVMLTS